MSNFQGLYDIRDFNPATDVNYVLATFLRGLYYGESWFSLIPKAVFMENYKRVAQTLVSSSKTTIKIACLKEDPDVIIGYSILSSDFQAIHWVFVRPAFRNKGIATSLVPRFPSVITHLSKTGLALKPKFKDCVFNPFYPVGVP